MKLKIVLLCFFTLLSCSKMEKSNIGKSVFLEVQEETQKYEKQCDEGDSFSCRRFARLLLATNTYEQANKIYKTRCALNQDFFCYYSAYSKLLISDYEKGLQDLQANCDKNNKYSCFALSYLLFEPNNRKLKIGYAKKACDLGLSRACFQLEYLKKQVVDLKTFIAMESKTLKLKEPDLHLLTHSLRPFVSSNRDFVMNRSTKYCSLGSKDACYFKEMFKIASNTTQSKNLEMSLKHCHDGSGLACMNICSIEYAKRNFEYAFGICKKSCLHAEGYGASCRVMGNIADRIGNRLDAAFFSKLGCLDASRDSCYNQAYFLEKDKQYTEASKPLEFLCKTGDAGACLRLSFVSGLQDLEEDRAKYTKKACDLGNGQGCYSYGVKLHIEKNPEHHNYFKKSCDLNNSAGCFGMCLSETEKGDVDSAKKYLIKACEFSSSEACKKYQNIDFKKVNLDQEDLKQTCHYDPSKPWWYWAVIIAAGAATGNAIN